MTKEVQRQEIRKILKGFYVDIIIRKGEKAKLVAVGTYPPVWISSIDISRKIVRIWHSDDTIKVILKEVGAKIGKQQTTEVSYGQFRKLVGRLLIEMFAKTFIEFIHFN